MQDKDKVLDDIARVAGGAVSVMSGLSRQVKDEIKSRVEDAASEMDLVPREDFERLELLVSKMIEKQDEIEKRLDALETTKKKK